MFERWILRDSSSSIKVFPMFSPKRQVHYYFKINNKAQIIKGGGPINKNNIVDKKLQIINFTDMSSFHNWPYDWYIAYIQAQVFIELANWLKKWHQSSQRRAPTFFVKYLGNSTMETTQAFGVWKLQKSNFFIYSFPFSKFSQQKQTYRSRSKTGDIHHWRLCTRD